MEHPDKISLKEAVTEANRGTVKQRCAQQRKRLKQKYGLPGSRLSKVMIETLKWMVANGGHSINFGCPATDATFKALRDRHLIWRNCSHYELTKAGIDATL